MKEFLKHIVVDLKNISKSLDKKSILIDKPWALIDSDFEMQKLIFKKNNELIMSKDGNVTMGKWEYLAEAKSILIDRGKDKILCNEAFIDEGVLILKVDGIRSEFFVLANENIIPDLDAYSYLKKLRYEKLIIVTRKLLNGKTLEIILNKSDYGEPGRGNLVSIDAESLEDGDYQDFDEIKKYVIKNNKIMEILHRRVIITRNKLKLEIDQSNEGGYSFNDRVWIDSKPAPDGEYKLGFLKGSIIIKDGLIYG